MRIADCCWHRQICLGRCGCVGRRSPFPVGAGSDFLVSARTRILIMVVFLALPRTLEQLMRAKSPLQYPDHVSHNRPVQLRSLAPVALALSLALLASKYSRVLWHSRSHSKWHTDSHAVAMLVLVADGFVIVTLILLRSHPGAASRPALAAVTHGLCPLTASRPYQPCPSTLSNSFVLLPIARSQSTFKVVFRWIRWMRAIRDSGCQHSEPGPLQEGCHVPM